MFTITLSLLTYLVIIIYTFIQSLVKKYHGNMIVKSTMVFYTIVLLPW